MDTKIKAVRKVKEKTLKDLSKQKTFSRKDLGYILNVICSAVDEEAYSSVYYVQENLGFGRHKSS